MREIGVFVHPEALTAESVAYKGLTYLKNRIIDVMKKRMVMDKFEKKDG